jgi:hypothetical protein
LTVEDCKQKLQEEEELKKVRAEKMREGKAKKQAEKAIKVDL